MCLKELKVNNKNIIFLVILFCGIQFCFAQWTNDIKRIRFLAGTHRNPLLSRMVKTVLFLSCKTTHSMQRFTHSDLVLIVNANGCLNSDLE